MTKDYSNAGITSEVRNLVFRYGNPIVLMNGLEFKQRDLIRMTEFYVNSRYLNGQKDELGREKPFYNIVNGMCDVENAAKDIDTKDISATSDDGQHYTEAFLLSKDVYQWMKRVNFAKTLNDMRDAHTRYGSLLVKKVIAKEDGKRILRIEIPEWKNVITDQVNMLENPIVECHYMTPAQLQKKSASWKNVSDVMSDWMSQGAASSRIPIYEVRGWFPRAFYRELDGGRVTKADKSEFSYQLYYLAGQYSSDAFSDMLPMSESFGIGNLTPLYWEDDTEQVYKYAARKKRAGRAFGVGVVEEGEEAQVWTNDAVVKQARAMEYTTKVVAQSASKKLKGRNMLNEVDDGQILEHDDGKPITAVPLLPPGGLAQYQNLLVQWFTQFERATSAYSAQRGESPSSRTAARLQAAVLQQSGSVMQNITEDFGIFLTEIFEDWVMPYLASQLNTEHILAHDFSADELREIDRNFSINFANKAAKEAILSGQIVGEEDYSAFMRGADDFIKQTKATRFLKVPKDYYKNKSVHVTWNITGEQKDKQAAAENLLAILKIYQANPNITDDPILTTLLMNIIEQSGSGLSPTTFVAAIQEKARLAAAAAEKGAGRNPEKISQSINYKDLPPDGQRQLAAKAGIDINPSSVQEATVEGPSGGEVTMNPASAPVA